MPPRPVPTQKAVKGALLSLAEVRERASKIEASLTLGRRPAEMKDDMSALTRILGKSLKGIADLIPNTADALFTLQPKLKEAREACANLSTAISLGCSPDKALKRFNLALAEVKWIIDMLDIAVPQRAVVLTPFDTAGMRVSSTVERALASAGVTTFRADHALGGNLVANLMRSIERADFVVADLSRLNPNVMFEIGYAAGKGVPLLLIVSKDSESVPMDLAGTFYLVYNPSNMGPLSVEVRRFALSRAGQQLRDRRG